MWLDVVPRADIKKDMCLEEFGLRAQSLITILVSMVNITVFFGWPK